MKIRISTLILSLLFVMIMTGKAQTALVPNYHSNTVSVVNLLTNTVTTTIPVGVNPMGVCINPAGTKAYITNLYPNSLGNFTVTAIDVHTNMVIDSINVDSYPNSVVFSPDGSTAYVANNGDGKISVINTTTDVVITTITAGSPNSCPYGIAISPDGLKLYVSLYTVDSVSVINTTLNTVVATIPVGVNPTGITVTPDGSKLYVVNDNGFNQGTVSVINTATNTVTSTITAGTDVWVAAVNVDGSKLYVSNGGDHNVTVYNTATNALVATINVGNLPFGISFTPDGTKAVVANFQDSTISVINTSNYTVTNTIHVSSKCYSFGNYITNYPTTSGIFTINNAEEGTIIYPNPNNGIFSFKNLKIMDNDIQIFNALGKEVYHQLINQSIQSTIQLPQLTNGVYFYQVINEMGTERGKFVKQ